MAEKKEEGKIGRQIHTSNICMPSSDNDNKVAYTMKNRLDWQIDTQ